MLIEGQDIEFVNSLALPPVRQPRPREIRALLHDAGKYNMLAISRGADKPNPWLTPKVEMMVRLLDSPLGQAKQLPKVLVPRIIWNKREIEVSPCPKLIEEQVRPLLREIAVYWRGILFGNYEIQSAWTLNQINTHQMVLSDVLKLLGQKNAEKQVVNYMKGRLIAFVHAGNSTGKPF